MNEHIFTSPITNLKIVIKPQKRYRDHVGNPVREDGKYIKFINGQYKTSDEKEIQVLKEHKSKWPKEITFVDTKKLERQKKIQQRVEKELEEEERAEAESKTKPKKSTENKADKK